MLRILKGNKGISIIEILIVIAILLITLTSLLGLVNFSLGAANLIKQTTKANAISQEAMEAVRSIRDSDWTKLTNGNHGLTNVAGFWNFAGTENVINGFIRTILIENVSRNPITDNIEITYNPTNNDPDTKKATATVSWQERGRTHQVELVTYFTNWQQ